MKNLYLLKLQPGKQNNTHANSAGKTRIIYKNKANIEEKYFDITGVIMLVLDKKGIVERINNKGCQVLRVPAKKITGHKWFEEFVPKRISKQVRKVFSTLMNGKIKPVEYFENTILNAKGEERIIAWHNTVLKDKNGGITGTLSSGDDITDLVRTREELKASEEKYHTTFETTVSAIASFDASGKIIEYNKAAADLFGVTNKELLGRNLNELLIKDDLPRQAKALKKIIAGGRTYGAEYRAKRKNGSVIDLVVSSAAVKDKNGRFVRTISVMEDATERKFLENMLRESEEKYRLIFNSSNDAIMVHQPKKNGTPGKFIAVNKVACERLGYTAKEMLQMTPVDIHATNDRKVVKKSVSAIFKDKHVKFETFHKTKNGALIPVEITADLFNLRGEPTILIAARDITERRKAEVIIKESEKLFKTVFRTSPDAININRLSDGLFVDVNDGFTFGTGFTKADVTGKTSFQLDMWDDPEDRRHLMKALKKHGFVNNMQVVFRVKDGTKRRGFMSARIIMIKGEPHLLSIMRDMTERIKAEEALKESEELFRTAFKTSPDSININRLSDGMYISINEGFTMITGYNWDNVRDKTSAQINIWHNPEDRKRLVEGLKKQGFVNNLQAVFRMKNGKIRHGLMSAKIIMIKGEAHILSITRDLTDRIKAEEALKISEERYRSVISQTGQLVYDYYIDTGIVAWNGAIKDLTGYTAEEFNMEVSIDIWAEMIHPDDREQALRTLYTAQESCSKHQAEYRLRKKDGTYFDVLDDGVCLPDDDNRTVRMLGVLKDITAMKRAENAMRESEEKFRTISEQSLIGIGIVQDGKIKYFNDAFASVTGFSRQEIEVWKPLKYYEHINQEDMAMVMEQSEKKIKHDPAAVVHYPIRFTDKQGKVKWIDNYSNAIDFMGRPAVIFAQADITLIKNTQMELERAVKELERSNAELERFAYVASHDLQEPLRMVSSYVQLLERRYKDKLDADANDFINYAVDGASRMQKLIKDLLAYSRLGTREKTFVKLDTNAIIDKVKENLAGAISEKKARIVSDKMPEIAGDESQVLQLFQNLVGNAVKFSRQDRESILEISAVRKKDEWQFCFKDNGIGIDRQYFEKIFVIFQRLHAVTEYSGTGIGLAICKRIVENHGGKIWVESEKGSGTAFYFTVPDRKI